METILPNSVATLNNDDLIVSVASPLADYVSLNYNEDLIDISTIRIIEKPFSSVKILRLVTSKEIRQLVMKTTIHHPVNEAISKSINQSVVEYNILKDLYPKYESIAKCSIPRPIVIIPEMDTFIIEYIQGELLLDQLRYANYFASKKIFNVLKQQFYYSGCWLKYFQSFTGTSASGIESFDTTIERIEYRIRALHDGNDPRWDKDLGRRIKKYLEGQLKLSVREKIFITGRHGDFGPWNIIGNNEGICVIDFFGYKMDLIPLDFQKMLIFFEDSKYEFLYNKSRIQELMDSFKDGYGTLPYVPDNIIDICQLLHRVCSVYGNIYGSQNKLHQKIERNRCIKSNMIILNSICNMY